MRIGTWNVLSLNSPGHPELLTTELTRLNVPIIGLQEVRWTGCGETDINEYKFLWSGHANHRVQGVALAVHKRYRSAITSWKPLGPRLLLVRLKHSHGFLSIFVSYAPTELAGEESKDAFYQQLSDELRRVSRHDITVVLGDMNATIGPNRFGLDNIIGPNPFDHSTTNDNGDRMLNLCSTHNLKVLGTWYPHRLIHRTTWYSNTGTISKTIDHILVSGRWKVSSDCRVFRSAELGRTDHRLLVATFHLRLRRANTQPTSNRRLIPDTEKLYTPRYANSYSIAVRNRFATLDPPQSLEDDLEQLRETLLPVAVEVLGERRTRKRPWISDSSLDLVDRCRQARLNGLTSSYRDLCRRRRRSLRHDYTSWLNLIADEAELKFQENNLRPAYKAIRTLCEVDGTRRASPLLSDDGSLITEPSLKLARWSQYYTRALNKPRPPTSDALLSFSSLGAPDDRISLDAPSLNEVMAAIKRLPNGRAPGADGISGEMLRVASDSTAPRLHQICRRIWEEERVPTGWKEGIILPLYKNKGDRRDTSNYRPITLLSVPSKVITAIIFRRIKPLLLEKRRPQQAGFTPGRSTTDCILTLTILAQHRRMFRKPLYAAYVDLKAAFDSLDRDALWLLLHGLGVPSKYINILRNLYSDNTCRVRGENSLSDPFPTTSGVRQGCVAAPNLFNVAVDFWLNQTTERCPDLGADFHSRFTDICYADDVVLLSSILDTLAESLSALGEEASPLGFTINWTKTKIQSLSDFLSPLPRELNINSDRVEAVDSFVYLGSRVSNDCSSEAEIYRRLGLARSAFGRLSRVWRSKKVHVTTKIRILDTCVLPVLLYGCESWCLSASTTRRLDAYHRSCLRHLLRILWFHRITNAEVYARAGSATPISTIIRRRRLRLLGHIARLGPDTPARQVLAAASRPPPVHWRRPRGRPRLSWTAQVQDQHPLADLLQLAQNRRAFRDLIATIT